MFDIHIPLLSDQISIPTPSTGSLVLWGGLHSLSLQRLHASTELLQTRGGGLPTCSVALLQHQQEGINILSFRDAIKKLFCCKLSTELFGASIHEKSLFMYKLMSLISHKTQYKCKWKNKANSLSVQSSQDV